LTIAGAAGSLDHSRHGTNPDGNPITRGTNVMPTPLLRRIPAVLTVFIVVACVACGGADSKLDGVYHSVTGAPITLTIKAGKAIVTIANESRTLDYKVEGNRLTILNPQEGNAVFTINDDGTLNGELGVMTKKPI
jgi:hypothetical protein